MEWLNYHHLLYFWMVAREGSITAACKKLHLAQPTISAQLKALEDELGERLFTRVGRSLVLTDTGQLVYRYAQEIFTLGRELQDVLKGRPTGSPVRFNVGIADVIPKLMTYRVLEPALRLTQPIHLVCYEGKPAELLSRLSIHELDLVLTDAPMDPSIRVRAFSHLIGTSGVSVFGADRLAKQYRRGFPASLDGAPFLIPTATTAIRRALDQWFDETKIYPLRIAEFEDSALLKVFGEVGTGLFAAPTVIEAEIKRRYRVQLVGHLPEVQDRLYAISVERKVKHPAVLALLTAARESLFKSTSD